MSHHYATPGVYIEEVTSPGVITGVGTSTAAFIGSALRGPMNVPRRITSFDEFVDLYGGTRENRPWPYHFVEGQPYYMAFAVEGFFTNGGQEAYIVRVGTAAQASVTIRNNARENVFVVRARQDGAAGDNIRVATQRYAVQAAVTSSALVTNVMGATVTVDAPTGFRTDDFVTTDGANRAQINQILGSDLVLDAPLANAANGNNLRIADIPPAQSRVRVESTESLTAGGIAVISDDGSQLGTGRSERVLIHRADSSTNVVTFAESRITGAAGAVITVEDPDRFKISDQITTDGANQATIDRIAGNNLTLDGALAGAAVNDIVRPVGSPPTRALTYDMTADPPPTLTSVRVVVSGRATIGAVNGTILAVDPVDQFRPGDIVTVDGQDRAQINTIQGSDLTLDRALTGATQGATLRVADLTPAQTAFRVNSIADLHSGTVVLLRGDDANNAGTEIEEYAVIQGVDGAGFVTFEAIPPRLNTYNMNVAIGAEPILIPQEFRLIVTPPQSGTGTVQPERIENLSLNAHHPRYILNEGIVSLTEVTIGPPDVPPVTAAFPGALAAIGVNHPRTNGVDDNPSGLTAREYQTGLNALRDEDGVNMVCIPDAARHPEQLSIQRAMIDHCLQLEDRFAILDAIPGSPPSGPGSVEEQRTQVPSDRGFAALYYPWLVVRDPRTAAGQQARSMIVPPSGHMAGIYARTDIERGVHKAPANTSVRGVLGLEERLSDRQQGPLNRAGVNVLRIFPGTAQAIVWGARTTIDEGRPGYTDWRYVNIRRLMLYIEESIQEGISWAVFEPNNLQLWQKLKRTITEFLTRVWRDGALFGETAEKAFYVRIDEALNPDSVRQLGRLYIEIGVRPSYPAEFIIVRIGLWDGGAEISEL